MSINKTKERSMRMRYLLVALGLVLFTGGCSDESGMLPTSPGPTAEAIALEADLMSLEGPSQMLRQAAGAPALETYQLSFWVRRDKGTKIRVNYLPAAGERDRDEDGDRDGDRFLKFEVPEGSLVSWPGSGNQLKKRDSVLITLTIDTVLLSVHFEPSGLKFKQSRPAKLTIWYGNADPDLNADGAVNNADRVLANQISIWNEDDHGKHRKVKRIKSQNDWARREVTGPLHHFSGYGISW